MNKKQGTNAKSTNKEKKAHPSKEELRYLEGWKRARADYENLHRRLTEEREKARKEGTEHVFRSIVSVLDYFDAAFDSLPNDIAQHPWIDGVRHVYKALQDALEAEGIQTIDAVNIPFDPSLHEAVEHIEHSTPIGTVVHVISKGYTQENTVLRAARVQVSAGSRETSQKPANAHNSKSDKKTKDEQN